MYCKNAYVIHETQEQEYGSSWRITENKNTLKYT